MSGWRQPQRQRKRLRSHSAAPPCPRGTVVCGYAPFCRAEELKESEQKEKISPGRPLQQGDSERCCVIV